MFDGYQEELSTKHGAHERRTMDFTRDMVMKSKKEDLLSNKQRFIRMLAWNMLGANHAMPRVMHMS